MNESLKESFNGWMNDLINKSIDRWTDWSIDHVFNILLLLLTIIAVPVTIYVHMYVIILLYSSFLVEIRDHKTMFSLCSHAPYSIYPLCHMYMYTLHHTCEPTYKRSRHVCNYVFSNIYSYIHIYSCIVYMSEV